MTKEQSVGKRIRKFREKFDMSVYDLSQKCGIDEKVINAIPRSFIRGNGVNYFAVDGSIHNGIQSNAVGILFCEVQKSAVMIAMNVSHDPNANVNILGGSVQIAEGLIKRILRASD